LPITDCIVRPTVSLKGAGWPTVYAYSGANVLTVGLCVVVRVEEPTLYC